MALRKEARLQCAHHLRIARLTISHSAVLQIVIARREPGVANLAVRLGLSDSVMLILYALEDAGGQIPLTTIYRQTGASKQTINSALRKLETDGHILLRMADGKRKIVCLTESGKIYAARTAGRLLAAENEIYGAWPKEDLEAYLRLTEKYLKELREKARRIRRFPRADRVVRPYAKFEGFT